MEVVGVIGLAIQFLILLLTEVFGAEGRRRAADEKFATREQALEAAALAAMDKLRARMAKDNDVARRQQSRLDDLMNGRDDG